MAENGGEILKYNDFEFTVIWNFSDAPQNKIFREPYRVCKLSENNHALWHNTMNIYYISFNGIDNCHLPTKSYIAHQLTIFDGQLNINAG